MDAQLITADTLREMAELKISLAKDEFSEYRKYIRPNMIWGWWPAEVALHLQNFYKAFKAGKRPIMVFMAPPQHGKSWAVEDFILWLAGKDPDLKTMFASFSDDLCIRINMSLRRTIPSARYAAVFPDTIIGKHGWKCDTDLVEYVNHTGSFRTTTVRGAINGMEQHIGVIDDPLKGRAEANSELIRNSTFDWFIDDFMSRFNKNSGLILMMTRWHLDDLAGRVVELFPQAKILKYPAIAEHDSKRRKKGDALFPELKPLDMLMERKRTQTVAGWQSLYQQDPIVVGGDVFPVEKFAIIPVLNKAEILHSCRYWDKAGTEDGGCYTAGVLMHKLRDGRFVIDHVARGQWSALDREKAIKLWTTDDASRFPSYEVVVEQEPGSGGLESAENTVRMLAGYVVSKDKVTGKKHIRWEPYAAQVENFNVLLCAGPWVHDFLNEHESARRDGTTAGKYRDQIDAAAGAFATLALKSDYDYSYSGWQPGREEAA